jgi:hypothetical protein
MANGEKRQDVNVVRKSPFSGITHAMNICLDMEDYQAWKSGKLIQNAFPYLSADEREFLMTGITPDEWNSAFKPSTLDQGDQDA